MNHPIWSTCLLFALVSLLTVMACNGDDDPTVSERGVPSFFDLTLFGIPALEGLVTDEVGLDETGEDEPRTFKTLEPSAGLEYGPQEGRLVISRGIYTFDLSKIAPGSPIESARLFLFQNFVEGRPYQFMEEIVVDHIDTSMFEELEPPLFNDFTLESNIGTISEDRRLGFKMLDVTSQVQADSDAGRDTSSFRLRGLKEQLFQLEGDDQAFFTDSLNDLGFVPEMDVVYENLESAANQGSSPSEESSSSEESSPSGSE